MIRMNEHRLWWDNGNVPYGKRLPYRYVDMHATQHLLDEIVAECVKDKCTNPIVEEVLDRFTAYSAMVKADNNNRCRLEYKSMGKEILSFEYPVQDLLDRLKTYIKHHVRTTYPYCFKKGVLTYLGDDIETHIAVQKNKASKTAANRVASMPHSEKLKKQLIEENKEAIRRAGNSIHSSKYSVVNVSTYMIKTWLKENYDVEGDKRLDEVEMAKAALEYATGHLYIYEPSLSENARKEYKDGIR